MQIERLIEKINTFRDGSTVQAWRMDQEVAYSNNYIDLVRIDTTNKSGGGV